MAELLYLAALAAAAYGAGSFFLNIGKVKFRSFGEEALFSEVAGLIIIAYATLFSGIAGMLDGTQYKIAVALIILLSLSKQKRLLMHFLSIARSKPNYRLKLHSLLLLALIVLAVSNILASLAPVHSSDAVAYHVATPKIYASEGKISFIPFMVTSAYPMITEMLFLDGYLLDGGKLSEAVAALIAILTTLAIYIFAKKNFGPTTAIIAAAAFYTLPIVSVFNTRGFVDISTAMFGMMAIFALFNWNESNDRKMLVLAGMFAGAAASTKISAYPLPAIFLLAVAYTALVLKKGNLKDLVRDLATYSIPAAIVVMPWLTRAFDYTGNPFYPLLSGAFGGPYLPEWLARFWTESLSFVGFGTGVMQLITMPWDVTMHTSTYGEQLGIGPLFLAFVPLLMLVRKVNRKVLGLLAIALPLMTVWFYTAQSLRYAFLTYAIMAIAAGYVISRLSIEKYGKAITTILLLTFALNSLFWIGANNDELKVVAGITSEEDFLKEKVANYELLQYANNNLEGSKVCLYGRLEGYYSQNDYVWCNPLFQGYVDFYQAESKAQLLKRMKEIGVTHIVDDGTMEYWKQFYGSLPTAKAVMENVDKLMPELLRENAKVVYSKGNGKIYEINY